MNQTPDEIKRRLNDPIHVHYHISDIEPRLTPLALHNLEFLHEDALALIQQLEARNLAMNNTILSVMHFVDKWLDCPDYDPDVDLNGVDAVQRAAKAREIALKAIAKFEAERDALLSAVKKFASCTYCKNLIRHGGDCPGGRRCVLFRNTGFEFEWRGVQKEETT